MLIRNNKLAVCPLTTHVDIKDVPKKINIKKIVKKLQLLTIGIEKFKKKKPKFAVLGLNPQRRI